MPVVFAVACLLTLHPASASRASHASPEAALAETLAAHGLECDASDVLWVHGPKGVFEAIRGGGRALVRANTPGEPRDLYLVEARLSPEGTVLEVGNVYNVTGTSGVDESRPILDGHLAAYVTSADGLSTGVHVLDLAGRPSASYSDFTALQRLQLSITNIQQTGQTNGILRDTFALDPVAAKAEIAWLPDGVLDIRADGRQIIVDARSTRVLVGEASVRVVPDERARPGNLVTWAVDRVRAEPWFGNERMQWLKAVAFTILDRWHAHFSHGTTAQEVKDELGLMPPPNPPTAFADPEIGWPPAPMKTIVAATLPGEGRWIALDNDPFITPAPAGAGSAMVTSFVRPDPRRLDVRVYVTLWDPRQIALHIEAGTVEPISANGEHGPGLVPRTPEVMKHLVAAFNGGFQAEHGEFGMQANGIEYLPPKPYAATVMDLRDGSTAFGAWPDSSAVPDDVVAFRQNLTALVQNDAFNPWGRTWWGGTPPGWTDNIHSARSAICLTKEGFVGYFYSPSVSAQDLAAGMLDARCSFGIHLDMNPGHAGFELYNVAPDGRLNPLRRSLQGDWEAEGKVAGMPGWAFRARRMIRGMGHMLFPRYIQREARDFFYLTARSVLPGAPIPPKAIADGSDEGLWRTTGLPQHGFPYALATTSVHERTPDGIPIEMRVLRFDPRTMQAGDGAAGGSPTVLSIESEGRGSASLWWYDGLFSIGASAPKAGALRVAGGFAASAPAAASSRAAVGVQDEDGMVDWVELVGQEQRSAQAVAAMVALLERLGCSARMVLSHDSRALIGGTLDTAGEIARPEASGPATRFVRVRGPDAHAAFVDTPIVSNSTWQPLQAKRVRYFYKPPSEAAAEGGAVKRGDVSSAPNAVAAQPATSASTSTGGEPPTRPW